MNFGENFFRTGIVEGIFRCSRVGTEEPAGAEKNAAKIAGDYALVMPSLRKISSMGIPAVP